MQLSYALPRIEEVGLELNGDIGTLAVKEGRENVLRALEACGWVGERGKLRRLTLTWGCCCGFDCVRCEGNDGKG